MDFIVLETEPITDNYKPVPVILGCLFLAIANVLINCKNEIMNLSFGNMIVKLNIFNIYKQLYKDDNEDMSIDLI